MMDIDSLIAEIRAGLEGVTPGPWFQTGSPWFKSGDGVLAGSPDGNIAFIIADCDTFSMSREEYTGPFPIGDAERDAAHIARCSPNNIAALLARLEAAEARADKAEAERDAAKRWYVDAIEQRDKYAKLWDTAARRVEKLEARLEIDHVFVLGEGDELVRRDVPAAERDAMIDGVEARNATIAGQDEQIDKLRADRDRLAAVVAAARSVIGPLAAMAALYDPPEGDDDQDAWAYGARPTIGQLRAARAWQDKHGEAG